jgi:hypothetical protein
MYASDLWISSDTCGAQLSSREDRAGGAARQAGDSAAQREMGQAHLVQTELFGTFAKDKEHGVNDVGLAAAVGTDDRGESLPKRHRAVTTDPPDGPRATGGRGCLECATTCTLCTPRARSSRACPPCSEPSSRATVHGAGAGQAAAGAEGKDSRGSAGAPTHNG